MVAWQGGTVVNHDHEFAADVLMQDGLITQVAKGIQVRGRGFPVLTRRLHSMQLSWAHQARNASAGQDHGAGQDT